MPRIGRVVIGRGRDAVDVALSTVYGAAVLEKFVVWSDEITPTQPGGTPSNNLGHLALNDQVQKVWSADAGTGSSSSGRLSAEPLVADGKVFTLDAGGTVSAS